MATKDIFLGCVATNIVSIKKKNIPFSINTNDFHHTNLKYVPGYTVSAFAQVSCTSPSYQCVLEQQLERVAG